MPEAFEQLLYPILAVVAWLSWALASETRHNHGFWVAMLLPLALLLLPLLWLACFALRWLSFAAFVACGRRAKHAEFMRRLRMRCGLFLLF